MATLARARELSFPVEARDIGFWDDGTLLLTTPSAEVWQADIAAAAGESVLLHPANRVIQPVAEAVGLPNAEPAGGRYPRLAASALAGAVIVNTSDLVLVACPRPGEIAGRLLHLGCGEYYPRMAFSRDGSRFTVCADTLLVFDTGSWKKKARDDSGVFAWHPREPRLLFLDAVTGRLMWTDWRNVARPASWPVGTLSPSEGRVEPAGLVVDATADRCVTAYRHPDRLEWWQLQPLRMVAAQPVGGEVFDLYPGPRADVFAVETEAGVQLWDFEARAPVSDVITGNTGVKSSPSGLWCVTLSRIPSNPHPMHPGEAKRTITLWKVL